MGIEPTRVYLLALSMVLQTMRNSQFHTPQTIRVGSQGTKKQFPCLMFVIEIRFLPADRTYMMRRIAVEKSEVR